MEEIEQSTYFINEREVPTDDVHVFQQLTGKTVYEVIRVQEGVPLFLEDHLERFRKSAAAIKLPLTVSDEVLGERIRQLISRNQVENQNIRMIWGEAEEKVLLLYFTKTTYPPNEYYQTGMHTDLLKLEREDPNLKLQRAEYQKIVLKEREKKGAYELLLVDKHDFVTEGSRSNIFFVKNGKIYTPPAKAVLLGIVRKKVLEICQQQQFEVVEKMLSVSELKEFEGAFITGTGNNVLPIQSIGKLHLDSTKNAVVQTLVRQFDQLVADYIQSHSGNHPA